MCGDKWKKLYLRAVSWCVARLVHVSSIRVIDMFLNYKYVIVENNSKWVD